MKNYILSITIAFLMVSAVGAGSESTISDLIDAIGSGLTSNNTAIKSEVEPNGTTLLARNLNNDLINPGDPTDDSIYNVLINGAISSVTDIDFSRLSLSGQGRLGVRFNMLDVHYEEITGGAYDSLNGRVVFVADKRSVLAPSLVNPDKLELLLSAGQLASLVPGPPAAEIGDIAVLADGTVVLTIVNRAEVVAIADGIAWRALNENDIIALTGEASAVLNSVVGDAEKVYFTEHISGSIISTDYNFDNLGFYISPAIMRESLITDLHIDINALVSSTPQTVLARSSASVFAGTSMVYVEGGGQYAQGFFVSQFGSIGTGGDGSITYISPDEDSPTDAVFTKLFDAGDNVDLLRLNPTALAVPGANVDFLDRIYFGTFGAAMGDEMDGEVYIANSNGTIQKFATQFVDRFGVTAMRGGAPITGFYDVIDMAFSPASFSPFGNYLYLISENGTTQYFGYGRPSDLWRVNKNGRAELFVESFMDYAGSLAFDTSGLYGNALLVARWDRATIVKINASGEVTPFFDSAELGGILDMAFSPADSILQGHLTFTVRAGNVTRLMTIDPDGELKVWASNLPTGDVPSGDIVFDVSGNLYVLNSSNKGISRIDYQDLHSYTLGQMRIGDIDGEQVPYVLVNIADQPRILRISGDSLGEVVTEVSPSFTDVGIAPADGSKHITFDFDSDGTMFAYYRNSKAFAKSPRNDVDGIFDQWVSMSGSYFGNQFGLLDIKVETMFFGADDIVYWVAGNGAGNNINDPPSQVLDDKIVSFVPSNEDGEPDDFETVISASQMNQMQVAITGPGTYSQVIIADVSSISEKIYDDLAAGTYYIAISSIAGVTGDYELLVEVAGSEDDIVVDADNSPMELETAEGHTVKVTYNGRGRAVLDVIRRPVSGKISSFVAVRMEDSATNTELIIENIDEPDDLHIDSLILDNSLRSIVIAGDVGEVVGIADRSRQVSSLQVNKVKMVTAENYNFNLFVATELGDPQISTVRRFLVRSLSQLVVYGDIYNSQFFDIDNRNNLRRVSVSGVVDGCMFSGASIGVFEILNIGDEPGALVDSAIYLNNRLSHLNIAKGNITNSVVSADRRVDNVLLVNGGLISSQIRSMAARGSAIGQVLILGDITGSTIETRRSIRTVYAQGNISSNSYIRATGVPRTSIGRIGSGGNNAGRMNAETIRDVMVGYDSNFRRREEGPGYTGSNFTGTITVTRDLRALRVTGKIINGNIISANNIGGIYAEDGFKANVQALRTIRQVMVGFIDGRRNRPSTTIDRTGATYTLEGSISAQRCSSILYIGRRQENMALPFNHRIIQVVPKN